MIIDFSVEHSVVGEKFDGCSWRNMGGLVIYIEDGAKNSILWDSRAHVYLTRLAPFYKHFLVSIGKNNFNPEVDYGGQCRKP